MVKLPHKMESQLEHAGLKIPKWPLFSPRCDGGRMRLFMAEEMSTRDQKMSPNAAEK